MYSTGESIQSLQSVARLTTCQFKGRSVSALAKRQRFEMSRGRFAQKPSKRSLFMKMGCRPRERKSNVKEVSTTSLSPRHEPSAFCSWSACVANSRYQSCLPKYLNPLASAARSRPYRLYDLKSCGSVTELSSVSSHFNPRV